MTESDEKVAKALEARLDHDDIVSQVLDGKLAGKMTDEAINDYVNEAAGKFLDAENALTIPEFNRYMTQYRARKG